MRIAGILLLVLATRTGAATTNEILISVKPLPEKSRCYELVLDKGFGAWDKVPADLRTMHLTTSGGRPVVAVFVEGNARSRYGRWLVDGTEISADELKNLHMEFRGQPGDRVNDGRGPLIGGSASAVASGAKSSGEQVLGFDLRLSGTGWANAGPPPLLFPGGPTAEQAMPLYNDPATPLVSCSQFAAQDIGSAGIRDFHVVTEPGGRACLHEGYYYALVMGMRLKADKSTRLGGRLDTDRALMWTRAKTLDGPWEKPIILLSPRGPWATVDQGTMVRTPRGEFVLLFRAQVGDRLGLYVLNSPSPTGFQLPTEAPPPAFDATRLECAPPPSDFLALPYMIKLTEASSVDGIPGTRGAFVAYFEVRQFHQGKSKWHVYGAYASDARGHGPWNPLNGGHPVLAVDDDPQSAWHWGVANPKIIEVGPEQFVAGVNAYGKNGRESQDYQDWRLWFGFSGNCARFPRNSFRCAIGQYEGEGDHAGRIESAHWVLGPTEPLNGPMRIVYFAAPFRTQPETFYSHIYAAYTPTAQFAGELELGTRGKNDSSYLYRQLESGQAATIELAIDTDHRESQRGIEFLPAILDRSDPQTADGLAVVRNSEGLFGLWEIKSGALARHWNLDRKALCASDTQSSERGTLSRLAAIVRRPRLRAMLPATLGLAIGALIVAAWRHSWRKRAAAFLLAAGLAAVIGLIVPLSTERVPAGKPAATDGAWHGPGGIQQAHVRIQLVDRMLKVDISGLQGRPWLTAEVPLASEQCRHLFVGKTAGTGEMCRTNVQYLLVHPPSPRLTLEPL